MLLTIGFFAFHYWLKIDRAPHFVDSVAPYYSADKIAYNEFLILMDVGEENRLNEVLQKFDLEIITPLGEWTHVAKRESKDRQQQVELTSPRADLNIALRNEIEDHDAVHSVELNYIQNSDAMVSCTDFWSNGKQTSQATVLPKDPYFDYQWHLSKESGVDLPGAWTITTGSKNTVVALVDRGFDFSESDMSMDRCEGRKFFHENILDYFPQQLSPGKTESTRHGSQVMSVIGACTDNEVGLAGIDWHAQIFGVDTKENASFSARMLGILWAAGVDVCTSSIKACPKASHFQKNMHPANVINTSFGFAGDYLLNPPYGPVLDAVGRINRQGRIIVASAGNESQIADRRLPGSAGGVISVGASNKQHQSSSFSNIGRSVDVVAPGEDIVGIYKGRPISLNGTSFSSPIVAGIASLLLAVNPLFAWKHIEYFLKETASPMACDDFCPKSMGQPFQRTCRDYCCEGEKNFCGRGIVNAAAAVKMADAGFPDCALIDIDDYFIALSDDNDLSAKITLKNWGKRTAVAHMRKTDRHLKLWPESVHVPPITKDGVPGMVEATIFYDAEPERNVIASLLIEAANSDDPTKFHDRIEAIVSIIPDPRDEKIELKELLPKK